MNKILKEIKQITSRLIEANVNMEHYWFFPKTKLVPVEVENTQPKVDLMNH